MGFNWKWLLAGGIVVAYFLFPLDVIPDFIPLVGWVDDAVVAALSYFFLVKR